MPPFNPAGLGGSLGWGQRPAGFQAPRKQGGWHVHMLCLQGSFPGCGGHGHSPAWALPGCVETPSPEKSFPLPARAPCISPQRAGPSWETRLVPSWVLSSHGQDAQGRWSGGGSVSLWKVTEEHWVRSSGCGPLGLVHMGWLEARPGSVGLRGWRGGQGPAGAGAEGWGCLPAGAVSLQLSVGRTFHEK